MSTSSEWLATPGFKNRYFIIRHGESEANKAGIVSSTYKVAVANHGLTEKGVAQALGCSSVLLDLASKPAPSTDILGNETQTQSIALLNSFNDVLFYASDFAR